MSSDPHSGLVLVRFLRGSVASLCALAALACGGGDLVLPADSQPAQLEKIQGDEQVGSAGLPLADPLAVKVVDQGGRALEGLEVSFALGEGADGGNLDPATALTDSRGLAVATWTLGGNAGAQAVDVRVTGTELVAQFTASAGSSEATRIEIANGNEQSAPVGTALADSLVVRVTDAFGNPVAGIQVAWSASAGDVNPTLASTDEDGLAATRRILGAGAGAQTAEAAVPGLEGSPVTFTHTATPGTAASLVLISGDDQTGEPGDELPQPLVVRLVDEAGNGIPDRAVTWLVTTGGGSVTPGTGNTDPDGLASARWTLGPERGPNTVNAVVSGVGVVAFTANGSGGGGGGGGGGSGPSASRSTVSADPTSIEAITGTSTITVTVRDGSGAGIQGATVALSATGSGNTLTQPSGPTGADGVATGSLRSAVPGTKVVTATVNGSVQINQTAQVSVAVAPASRVELLEGDGQTAPEGSNVPTRPAVRVLDALGQPVAGFGVTFVVTGGGGSVTGASQTTNSNGVARVGSWTLGAAGANTLEARAGSLDGSPVVFQATATAAANRLVFRVQPSDVDEDEEFSPPVQVALVDGSGSVVPQSGIEIELELIREGGQVDNGRLEGDRRVETVNGVAVFANLRVRNDDENYRLRASALDLPGVAPVTSTPFDVEND
jgi:hypothetical protein